MEQELNHYEFINSQTGNIIAYLSLPADMDEKEQAAQLEKKIMELAIKHNLYFDLIYWQLHDHCIK